MKPEDRAKKIRSSKKVDSCFDPKEQKQLEHLIDETLTRAYMEGETEWEEVKSELENKVSKPKNQEYIPEMNTKQYLDLINNVIDPETGLGIVDMGLIYDVVENEDGKIDVTMTFTSMGCPAGQQLTTDVDAELRRLDHVTDVEVNVVFDPPWNAEMMNPELREMLFGDRNTF